MHACYIEGEMRRDERTSDGCGVTPWQTEESDLFRQVGQTFMIMIILSFSYNRYRQ